MCKYYLVMIFNHYYIQIINKDQTDDSIELNLKK